MPNTPLRAAAKRRVPIHLSTRPAVGPPDSFGKGPEPLGRLLRQGLVVGACVAASMVLCAIIIPLLPSYYMAEARVLVDGLPPRIVLDEQARGIARQVIAELHLDTDADFGSPLRPETWWKTPLLMDIGAWLRTRIGIAMPGLPDDSASASLVPPRTEDQMLDRFWSRVDMSLLGRSSKILSIRATAKDPYQAAAIADGLARHHLAGGIPIASAIPPTEPVFPPKELIVLLGFLGGVALGIAVLQAWGRAAKTFRRADEIQNATHLPVMAMVPQMKDGKTAISHVLREPVSAYTESLRRLYANLKTATWGDPPKTVAVGSAIPAEGRSILAASVGRLLAVEGKRVLLIDCDWRHPDLHRLFRIPNDTGLASLLSGEHIALDDVIHTDALSGLDIIAAGQKHRLTRSMLVSDRMRKILAVFSRSYELVLLDIPPLALSNGVLPLSRMVDKMIFVVRWRHTRRQMSLGAIERILGARGDVAGIVLTRVDAVRYLKTQTRRMPGFGGASRASRRSIF